ncbi:MAG: AI-2E family transporter [Magnetococcales bacterium]|nr:AI-2E family transporter [Magnetococcales bacterium]
MLLSNRIRTFSPPDSALFCREPTTTFNHHPPVMLDSNHPQPDVVHQPQPHQQGFLLLLILLASAGLLWLFVPFIPGLFLAVLLATATFPLYRRLSLRFSLESDKAALLMTVLIFFLVISPILYLLSASALLASDFVVRMRDWVSGFENNAAMVESGKNIVYSLPIPDFLQNFLLDEVAKNQESLVKTLTNGMLSLFQGITNNSLAFIYSLILVVFSLFFFYRDGPALVHKLRLLTPLPNLYDDFLLNRFAGLATVLTMSTVAISLIQGISFATIAAFLGLQWFFFGVSLAVTSFIPVIGGPIIWGPLAYYLFASGREGSGLFVLLWGAIVNGFLIDNVLRPILIRHLSTWHASEDPDNDLSSLGHTFLTTLATFGGIIDFGILGLFFGPVIAAMAIAIFELYEKIYHDQLDHS